MNKRHSGTAATIGLMVLMMLILDDACNRMKGARAPVDRGASSNAHVRSIDVSRLYVSQMELVVLQDCQILKYSMGKHQSKIEFVPCKD